MDMFSALAEPNRRSILEMLASNGQLSATAISRKFHVSPPAISQHLKVLREARLVRMEKRAQQRLYEINPQAMLELEDWARRMAAQQERRFDALEKILKAEEQKTPTLRSRKDKQHGNSNEGHKGNHRGKDKTRR
jgi:DNA-binding transcriptional ArsR family regulator